MDRRREVQRERKGREGEQILLGISQGHYVLNEIKVGGGYGGWEECQLFTFLFKQ